VPDESTQNSAVCAPGDRGQKPILADPEHGWRSFSSTAEHRRMRRRVQIQPNNVGAFSQNRIVRGNVGSIAMGWRPCLRHNRAHHHVADVQMRSELGAPVGCSTARHMGGRLQNPGSSSRRETVALAPNAAVRSPAMRCSVKSLLSGYKTRLQSTRSDNPLIPVWPSPAARQPRRRAYAARSVRLLARRSFHKTPSFVKTDRVLIDTIIVYKWLLQSTVSAPRFQRDVSAI